MIFGLMFFYAILFNPQANPSRMSNSLLTFSIAFLTFGIYLIYLTRQKLKLTFLELNLSVTEKEKIIIQVSKTLKWSFNRKAENYFRFVDYGGAFRASSNVSILFDEYGYYVNVFDTKWRPLDFGSQRKKTSKILEAIEGCVQQGAL